MGLNVNGMNGLIFILRELPRLELNQSNKTKVIISNNYKKLKGKFMSP